MTTSSYHPGYKFSRTYLHDMGSDLTNVEIDTIATLIVDRFEELANEAGDPSISWCPYTSEVYYECIGESPNPLTPIHDLTRELEDMRKQATEEVWAVTCQDPRPVTVKEETWDGWITEIRPPTNQPADELTDHGSELVEFTESPQGRRALEQWAKRCNELNGAPEDDFDR